VGGKILTWPVKPPPEKHHLERFIWVDDEWEKVVYGEGVLKWRTRSDKLYTPFVFFL
jgi:hypothetical protein